MTLIAVGGGRHLAKLSLLEGIGFKGYQHIEGEI